ncbi:MAG: chorismate mutase [Pyrinomonadaceae bacterium]
MSIEDWRREIDDVDRELLRLLNMRARLALKVGALKRDAGLPLSDAEREQEVLTEVCRENGGPLTDRAVAKLFRRIIRESIHLQARAAEESSVEEVSGSRL